MSSHQCLWTECDAWKLTDDLRARVWQEYKAYGRITIELVREIKAFYDKPPELLQDSGPHNE